MPPPRCTRRGSRLIDADEFIVDEAVTTRLLEINAEARATHASVLVRDFTSVAA